MKRYLLSFACLGLALFGLTCPGAAQNAAAVKRAKSACGPAGVDFQVDTSANGHNLPALSSDQGNVYVIEEYRNPSNKIGKSPTLRIGLDGQWVGAVHHDSYLLFPVAAGAHHFCIDWQSRLKGLSRLVSLTNFTAEPGKIYYFRARVTFRNAWQGAPWYTLDIEPVNDDEARLMLAQRRLGTSSIKK